MKFNDFIVSEEKVRLDPKCWTGKKIGNPKTKVKGGVRVNNCVPAESVEEAANAAQQAAIAIAKKKKAGVDEAAPPGAKAERMVKHIKKGYAKDGKLSDKEKSIAYATAWKAHNKGVTEAFNPVSEGMPVDNDMGATPSGAKMTLGQWKQMWMKKMPNADFAAMFRSPPNMQGSAIAYFDGWMNNPDARWDPQQGMTEGSQRVDSLVTDALKIMRGSEASDAVAALKTVLGDREYNSRRGFYNFYVRQLMDMSGQQGMAEGSRKAWMKHNELVDLEKPLDGLKAEFNNLLRTHDPEEKAKYQQGIKQRIKNQPMAGPKGQLPEDFNGEYDDEAGMADNNLETLERAVDGIDNLIQSGDNLPEWCQEKIAVAKSMLVAVWDYMYSEEASDEVDPEIDEMFEAMDQLAEEMARKKGVSVDLVWETFEAMDDHMLYETAAWRRKEGKSAKGGLNAKGVASYRRENPGSKLQTAVTTKPSKLKPGSKAAKRRKSFCARMGGVKGPMKKPNGKPTRKALALRKWNC